MKFAFNLFKLCSTTVESSVNLCIGRDIRYLVQAWGIVRLYDKSREFTFANDLQVNIRVITSPRCKIMPDGMTS